MAKTAIFVISDIVYALSTLVFFILLIITYTQLNGSNYAYMHSVGANWSSGPITSFNTQGDGCAMGESPLITDSWPGTVPGCYCSTSFDLYGPLRIGYCRRKRDSYIFCSDVNATPAIPYRFWRGKALCGARAPTTYLDLELARTEKECSKTSRSCGIVDSMNNVMCVPIQTPCPLNFIKTLPGTATMPTDMQYAVLELNGEKMLVSNQNTQGKILNEFAISDAQPCADPNYKNYRTEAYKLDPFYQKDKCDDQIGDIQFDDRYYPVDSYSSYSVLAENNIIPVIINLPLYPNQISNQHDINLYARNYIGLNPGCLNEIKEEGNGINLINDLFDIRENMSTAISLALAAMILGIVLFILVTFYLVLSFVIGYGNDDQKKKFFWLIAPFVITIVCLILCGILVTKVKQYNRDDYSVLTRKDCVDSITFQAANNFGDSLSTAKSLAIVSTFLLALLIIVPIIETILSCVE